MTPEQQELLGKMMKKLAKSEGHRPKLPDHPGFGSPQMDIHREKVVNYFRNQYDGPIGTATLSKILGSPMDAVREICKELMREGYLTTRRSKRGFNWRIVEGKSLPKPEDFLSAA